MDTAGAGAAAEQGEAVINEPILFVRPLFSRRLLFSSSSRFVTTSSSQTGCHVMRSRLTPVGFGHSVLATVFVVCIFAPARLPAQKTVGKKAGEERSDNKLKMRFCWCPKGKFTIGDAKLDVTLSRGFWMGKYEVTQAQYQSVTGNNVSAFKGDSLPVEMVTWTQATAFCEKLTKTERAAGRLPEGWEYRLPTQAQWEYACRAGTTTAYSFGNDAKQLGDYAWYGTNSGSKTHPVGQKKPNAWGLCDMHGNVWEWCVDQYQDWMRDKLSGTTHPKVTKGRDQGRVLRGGGWYVSAADCRSAYRGGMDPTDRTNYIGFRVARVPVGK
jgi:formylglycine-generating enzyme required for sulfatase activity